MSAYNQALQVNEELAELALRYSASFEAELLVLGHERLQNGINRQIIIAFLNKAGLPLSLTDDCGQEAYLKLSDVFLAFDPERTPSFISLWRVALKNHLISTFLPQWIHHQEDDAFRDYSSYTERDISTEHEVCDKIKREMTEWVNGPDWGGKWESQRAVVKEVLQERVFKLKGDRVTQPELAEKVGRSQGIIANWEEWLRSEIQRRYVDLGYNVDMSDWRDNAAKHLILLCYGQGIETYWESGVKDLLTEAAKRDKKLPESSRLGWAYIVDTYSDAAMQKFLNLVRRIWEKPEVSTPLQSPPEGSIHPYETTISLRLNGGYDRAALRQTLQNYLVDVLDFEVTIWDIAFVYGTWYDLRVRYSVGLPKVFQTLLAPAWVIDGCTKPISDYGKATLAMIR